MNFFPFYGLDLGWSSFDRHQSLLRDYLVVRLSRAVRLSPLWSYLLPHILQFPPTLLIQE
jgi:hypothetical protein